jgi:hypothetical protein
MTAFITSWIVAHIAELVGGSIAVFVVTWILNKIPTARVRKWIYELFFSLGAGISRFFNNWRVTKPVWEKALEPWLIGFLDMIFGAIMSGLFDGFRSDNKKEIKLD